MSNDEARRPDEPADEQVSEEAKQTRTPEEIAAAERRFFEARQAWLKDQEEKRGG